MKSTKTLVLILRVLGWLSIAGGIIFLILAVISPVTIYFKLIFFLLQSIPGFLGGLIFLSLACGLSREERWAWYFGVLVFSLSLILATINIIKGQFLYFFGVIINIILLSELIPEREIFIKQPKEKISQWFRKPCFIVVLVGILLLCLNVGILTYLGFNLSKEIREGLGETISANEYIQKAETEIAEIKKSLEEGNTAEITQHTIKAVEYGILATDLEPNNPEIWFRRGNIYWEIKDIVQDAGEWALKCYERALELDPDNQLYRQKVEEAKLYRQKMEELTK